MTFDVTTVIVSAFFSNRAFFNQRYVHCPLGQCHFTLKRVQNRVNINSICTAKPKNSCFIGTQEVLYIGTFKMQTFKGANVCSANIRRGTAAGPVSCRWPSFSSTISHLFSLLQSVSLPACSLDASRCTVPLYFSSYVL